MFGKVIKLVKGAGNGIDTACLFTASNMLIGKGELGDAATCQCDILRAFIIPTNDAMPDDLRCELYGPLVYEIIGTKTDDMGVVRRRAFAFADWAVREIAPMALRSAGLNDAAMTLETLPAIDNHAAADAAAVSAYAAYAGAAGSAAAYAASAAAVSARAAGAAAGSAAAYAAAYAADAAGVSARAAASAAAVSARAAGADVWRKCPEIILRVAAIGDKRPVEQAISLDELACKLI